MAKISAAVKIMHKRHINTFWRKLVYYWWHKPLFWVEDKLEMLKYKYDKAFSK